MIRHINPRLAEDHAFDKTAEAIALSAYVDDSRHVNLFGRPPATASGKVESVETTPEFTVGKLTDPGAQQGIGAGAVLAAPPTDPLIAQQWHLGAIGNLNAIWEDYTGVGVHVGVYDEGIEYSHFDLNDNYDASRHVVVGGTTYDGVVVGTQSHATAVAGLIAAEANGLGTVGVAYDATITGVNIFDSASGIYINAANPTNFYSALRSLNFDVVNNSWGSTPGYAASQNKDVANTFANNIASAWEYVAANGRPYFGLNLGTIVVKSAGNEYRNANASGENTSRAIIDVAAVGNSGFAASYSNHGANVLVSAPGSEFAQFGGLGIVTTDRLGTAGYNLRADPAGSYDYTDDFGGTSAAGPIVAAVTTLLLDADPSLGWREVQNILALSASHTGSALNAGVAGTNENDFWKFNGADNWNGGGLHFHNNYGFGIVNAYNAVRIAEVWGLFEPNIQISANEVSTTVAGSPALAIIDQGTVSTTFVVTNDINVENLQLTLNITHSFFGDLRIRLTAPDGAVYILEDGTGNANNSSSSDNGLTWTYGINGLRNQSPVGTWTITIQDAFAADVGTLNTFSATFYGSPASSNDVYHFTDEFQDVAALDASRRVVTDTDGGNDWLNMAAVPGTLNVNLTAGSSSTLDGAAFISIANGTTIENLITGDGNDTLTGNAVDNQLFGMRGNDTLIGGLGNDYLDGGRGVDTASYASASAGVRVDLTINGYQNTVAAGFDSLFNIENLTGSAFDDRLTPASDATSIVLTAATAHGALGAAYNLDAYFALNANPFVVDPTTVPHTTIHATSAGGVDYYVFTATEAGTVTVDIDGASFDTVVRLYDAGGVQIAYNDDDGGDPGSSGYFTFLDSRISYAVTTPGTYFFSVESFVGAIPANGTYNVTLSVPEHSTVDGTSVLLGGAGADSLYGGAGDDRIDGGTGVDRMFGGAGDDYYIVSVGSDRAIESAGQGLDTVESGVTYTLAANVENLILVGLANINAIGNNSDNILLGNDGNNTVTGYAGNDILVGFGGDDILNGGTGADQLVGGQGNDTYRVDNVGDTVLELDMGGDDSVTSTIDYTLSANVERLVLSNGARIGIGNDLANTILGATGNDTLSGLEGDDRLVGDAGTDTLLGGSGKDTLEGGIGRDTLTGGTEADRFLFRAGDTSAIRTQADRITDFSHAQGDRIALNLIDAKSGTAPNDAFTFIGYSAFHNVAGELRAAISGAFTYVEGDTNGDGIADLSIRLDGTAPLVAADFVL